MGISWKEELSVNIAEIDNQHKKLLEIGSRLQDMAMESQKYDCFDDLMNILRELKDYTIYHFQYEEDLLLHNEYDNFWEHKAEHVSFVKKLKSLDTNDLDSDQYGSIINLIDFVISWVTEHILGADMKYKSVLNDKGVY